MFGDPVFNNIEDNLDPVHQRFLNRRSIGLGRKFLGWYRALVVETNDPLQFRRVRVRVPELHNNDVETEDLPWAIPAPWMGGQNSGSWTHPCIDDIVFVCFENNHPYAPIYCSAADPTRRRMYSMWSIYTKSPQAVNIDGEPDGVPSDYLEDYLPKDGRPMSTGMSDRYGSFLNFSAYGFSPKSHKTKPASVGTDAIAKSEYSVNKEQPKDNEPDLKYVTMGTKYGHSMIMGDVGYQWFNEFKGDFEEDKDFEEKRYQYLTKYFNEQEAKDRDQRRIEMRSRLGHKFEMRDVGWDKSRSGEYDKQVTIGDSKGRDERWIKLRTKGGHLIQALDKGFDPEQDTFYKRLNKSEMGIDPDKDDSLGDDSRMIRMITRHGNMFILDDRGSDPKNGENETPYGNGVLLRSRRGHQLQFIDKDELNHVLITTSKNECLEMSGKHGHVILSTAQPGELATNVGSNEIKSKPPYVQKTGISNDPEGTTCHIKLDRVNDYVRMKTPDGAGFEARGESAPCGQWTETRDSENRAVWMSKTDQWLMIRNKTGEIYLVLDDNDDALMIRNEKDRIVIHAKKDIQFKSDEGNICFEAPAGQIGMTANKVAVSTSGAQHVLDGSGIGTTQKVQGATLAGKHDVLQIPVHPLAPAPAAPRGETPCKFNPKEIARKKPEDFDKERGCDPEKPNKGPVPPEVTDGGPGSGGSGDSTTPGGSSGAPGSDAPGDTPTVPAPITPPATPDPIEEKNPGSGGVLWYGTTSKFLNEIEEFGLTIKSLINNLNTPNDLEAKEIYLAKTLDVARDKTQAILAQKNYGGKSLIIRIRNLPDAGLLSPVPGNEDVLSYPEDISFDGYLEIYEQGTTEFTTPPPRFPNVS